MTQRREHVRRMLQVPATVQLAEGEGRWAVHLIDISRSGVAFASDRPLPDGASFRMSFWLPGTAQPCLAEGNVVYCMAFASSGRYRIGARFGPLAQAVREGIMDFVTEPLAHRPPRP